MNLWHESIHFAKIGFISFSQSNSKSTVTRSRIHFRLKLLSLWLLSVAKNWGECVRLYEKHATIMTRQINLSHSTCKILIGCRYSRFASLWFALKECINDIQKKWLIGGSSLESRGPKSTEKKSYAYMLVFAIFFLWFCLVVSCSGLCFHFGFGTTRRSIAAA